MPIKQIQVYECDICYKEYNPKDTQVHEYSGEFVTGIRIDGWYKPEKQAVNKYICKSCSSRLLSVIREIKSEV